MKRIVHGTAPSPFFRKVVITLHELDLDFEVHERIPLDKSAEFARLNPLQKIPVYQEGALTLPDSSVICAYLARSHPAQTLYPEEPARFGRALFYEEYADTRLAEVLSGLFVELFVKPNFMQQESDLERVAALEQSEMPECFDYLEAELEAKLEPASASADGGDYLVGDFSIADIATGAQLQALGFMGREIDPARWPRLAGYFARLMARPSFQKAMG